MGRIIGEYPIYLPKQSLLTERVVQRAHVETIHGGVGLTMAKVRNRYWVPKLRQMTKRVLRACHGCKRFHARPLPQPRVGLLPRDRTEGAIPFQTIGLDYAGPFFYSRKAKQNGKAYILLFACSLSRATCLELVSDQTLEEFLRSFKRFVCRRGRPSKIYSDNFSTFIAASKWVRKVTAAEEFHIFLSKQSIHWQFNLSKAPWWGGQYERLIGLVKQSLFKVLGKSLLRREELEDVLMDVELTLNNRPLSYLEDDVQIPTLTPNIMVFGMPHHPLSEDVEINENQDLRKRERYVRSCKDRIWKRWKSQYVRALRERHAVVTGAKEIQPRIGDIMMIEGEEKNRSFWRVGVVEKLIEGKDGVVRAVKLRCGKSQLERAVQHLYPLELSCDAHPSNRDEGNAPTDRERRTTAAIARVLIRDDAEQDPPSVE